MESCEAKKSAEDPRSVPETEIEIVYNNTSINRLMSLGPLLVPTRLIELGLDREPLIPSFPLAVTIPSKTYT
jgi:hypothetical protein